MASNINPYNIDGTFPIANQDNSSQGFRDNFTNIRNNLIFAETEITDLQSKVLVTSALTGQSLTNDMAGTQIRRPQLTAWTQSLLDLGAISGTASLDFNQANFQKITSAAPITLAFTNWPASSGAGALGYGLMRVWFVITDVSHTITLPSSVSISDEDIAGFDTTTRAITFDATGNYVFDFSSIDGGATYLITDITRNRSTQAGGIVITGYQYAEPTTNFSANVNLNISRYVMDPTGTITNGKLTLPNVVLDGTVISISSTEIITNLSVQSGPGTTVKPSANITLSAGTSIEYFYKASESKWYKVR
jgi:hypothetical protein